MNDPDRPLLQGDVTEYYKPPNPRPTWYLVIAYRRGARGDYWSVRGGHFTSRADAEGFAEHLSPCWSDYRIVEIPGETPSV